MGQQSALQYCKNFATAVSSFRAKLNQNNVIPSTIIFTYEKILFVQSPAVGYFFSVKLHALLISLVIKPNDVHFTAILHVNFSSLLL